METEDETVSRRACRRRFVLLGGGRVRVRWDCGAEKVIRNEPAVDVEYLADHLADVPHHHHHHLTKEKEPRLTSARSSW